ncbi:MAG: helix-turn-helix domain-containing protein [Flavobacteriales bacterium]|tara:strand:- start:1023 stop:1946 length:924 start_codon:yes stop_codon:yes gene_type:complete
MILNKEEKNNSNQFLKSIDIGSSSETAIDKEIFIAIHQNETSVLQKFNKLVSKDFIQFHFCLKGSCDLVFNEGSYKLSLSQGKSLLLYNPQRTLPINLINEAGSNVITLLISIKKFHLLFSDEASYITFLSRENILKKYYTEETISPSMSIVLTQLLNFNLNNSVKPLYFKGKTFELLSLYFNTSDEANLEQCPFLVSEANVNKIKLAKDIIINRLSEPPTLIDLANEIGLSLKKLKDGFKQIYGDSVYSFLIDYKMELARKLLESGDYNVNEVGLKIGYSTSSHFIAAFKKKYGTTPKKYFMSLSS